MSSKLNQKEVALLKEYTLFNPGMYLRKIPKECLCEGGGSPRKAHKQSRSPGAQICGSQGVWDRHGNRQSAAQRASFLFFQFNPALPGHCCELFDGRGTGSTSIWAWSCKHLPQTQLVLPARRHLRSKVVLCTRRRAGSKAKKAGALSVFSPRVVKPRSEGKAPEIMVEVLYENSGHPSSSPHSLVQSL